MSVTQEHSPPVILSTGEERLLDALQAAFGTPFTIIDVGPQPGSERDGLRVYPEIIPLVLQ